MCCVLPGVRRGQEEQVEQFHHPTGSHMQQNMINMKTHSNRLEYMSKHLASSPGLPSSLHKLVSL